MTDKSNEAKTIANRRGFLRSLGASAAGVSAAAVGITASAPPAEAAENLEVVRAKNLDRAGLLVHDVHEIGRASGRERV